ncbi:hypothetical protein [Atribacter laminatus]|uniref:hypothetical protein n=1 Tax=Atribacter laminatus TaxID=2847778 RepID=UPI001FEC0C1A|nr:hypothetical protein [Atribacter laminatus]
MPDDQIVIAAVRAKNTLLVGALWLLCNVNIPLTSTIVLTAKKSNEIIQVISIRFLPLFSEDNDLIAAVVFLLATMNAMSVFFTVSSKPSSTQYSATSSVLFPVSVFVLQSYYLSTYQPYAPVFLFRLLLAFMVLSNPLSLTDVLQYKYIISLNGWTYFLLK